MGLLSNVALCAALYDQLDVMRPITKFTVLRMSL